MFVCSCILLEIYKLYLDHTGFDGTWLIRGHVTGIPARVAFVALNASIGFIFLNDCHLACSESSLLVTSVSGAFSSLLHGFRLMFSETSNG